MAHGTPNRSLVYLAGISGAHSMKYLTDVLTQQGLPPADAARFATHFQPLTLARGEYFVRQGHIHDTMGFVAEGIFQYYHLLSSGDELTTYVTSDGGFIVSLTSFLRGAPAIENIRALTPATVGVVTRATFDALRGEIPTLNAFYLGMLEYQIVCIDQSRNALLTQTAEERYRHLLRDEPHLLQRVPLQYLASVLGITPRHLSRIRKQIV